MSMETLDPGHRTRLRACGWLADVLRAQGHAEAARALLDDDVLTAARTSLGPLVDTTLMLEGIDARLRIGEGGGLEPLQATLTHMRSALGPLSPETRRCERALAEEEAALVG